MAIPLLAAAGLLTSGITGIGKAIFGADQIADGREALNNAVRPEYNIQDEYYKNVSIGENQAQTGFNQASKDYYSTQSERGLQSGIDATLRGGGGVNAIAELYDRYNEGNRRVAAEDDQLRFTKINNLMQLNKDLAGQKTYKWAIDEYEPYKDLVRRANAGIASGTQNVFSGLGEVGSTLANAAIATSQQEQQPGQNSPYTASTLPSVNPRVPVASQPQIDAQLQPYLDILYKQRTNTTFN